MDHAVSAIAALFQASGAYGDGAIGEEISQRAHALQAADLARRAGADDAEVLGALLHDVGHLCAPESAARMGRHGVARHEEIGAAWLARLGFGGEVTELVRGHVAAKRYLVATRPDYAARLSPASRATLIAQGGPMSEAECGAFEASPSRGAWLRLRSWDEAAKVKDLVVPELDHYTPLIAAYLAVAIAPAYGTAEPEPARLR